LNYHQILNIILFHKNVIVKITAISGVLIFLILFFVFPESYESTVTVLPPEKDSQIGGLSGLLGGNADISSVITGGISNANSQLYIEILKSRSAGEYVVKKNNLMSYYDTDNLIKAVNYLQKDLNIELTKEGIIKLNVSVSTSLFPFFTKEKEKIKQLSAFISNSYIAALDSINRNKLTSKAKKARQYIEEQIYITKSVLDSVEEKLMYFQKSNKTISLPEQVKSAIDAGAKLRGEIASTEIDMGMASPNLREDNKTLIALKNKLEQLKEQYSKLEIGNGDYLVSFKEVPMLGRELASLLREVKIQNEVYLILQQQYYKEKIQENKDLPTLEVLDKAIIPLRATGPRVIFSSVFGGFTIFLLISLVFVYAENKKIREIGKNV
jgi:tyrosine-protein kinase Etk/Wzc